MGMERENMGLRSNRIKSDAGDEAGACFTGSPGSGIDTAQHPFGEGDIQPLGLPAWTSRLPGGRGWPQSRR